VGSRLVRPLHNCAEKAWQARANHVLKATEAIKDFAVSDLTLSQAIDNIYASIKNNNEELDTHIAALKAAMAREGAKEAVFEPGKLAQSNRQGRKIMQSYFKKKGVVVSFSA
jgi:hypothetical protein